MNENTQDNLATIQTALPFQPAEGETAAALEAFHCYFEMPTRSTPSALMLSTLRSNPAPPKFLHQITYKLGRGCGSTQNALNYELPFLNPVRSRLKRLTKIALPEISLKPLQKH